ncbi:MAG: sodium:solute symporter family protein [Leptospiraceae bacterium]|nr:sodium:solute symporter family protein [Leptospiraceae bacterium]
MKISNIEKLVMPLLYSTILFSIIMAFGLFFVERNPSFHWPSYIAMAGFYGIMFFVGLISSDKKEDEKPENMILAGRSLPLGVALMTMTATWVGGGFINGTAESVATSGLVWAQAPWGYGLSLIFGGFFFASKMRKMNYTTMLDPIEDRFGNKMAAILYVPALMGEMFWTAAVLTALGTTFGALLGIDAVTSIIMSSFITILYTSLGGLKAVALTDVVQLIILILGLWLTIPFLLPGDQNLFGVYSSYKASLGGKADLLPPLNALSHPEWGVKVFLWWDSALLLIFGGIPWHVYFQRVLSAQNPKIARNLSIGAGFMCMIAAIPAIIIGMIAHNIDWAALGHPNPESSAVILPHTLKYIGPVSIATIGLGALAAAVMSSADSSILSASTLGTWNVYRPFFLKENSDLTKIIKRLIWAIGLGATLIAIQVKSVYSLWFLCSDFVYCILFPQLLLALYDKKVTPIGSAVGFGVALFLRMGAGEPVLGIPSFIPYPFVIDGVSYFPYRTLAMSCSVITIMVVSRLIKEKERELIQREES